MSTSFITPPDYASTSVQNCSRTALILNSPDQVNDDGDIDYQHSDPHHRHPPLKFPDLKRNQTTCCYDGKPLCPVFPHQKANTFGQQQARVNKCPGANFF